MKRGIALVTGGSKGIGFAIARELYQDGWSVALTSREISRAKDAAEKIGPNVLPFEYTAPDIFTNNDKYEAYNGAQILLKQIHDTNNKIQVLVNAAGVSKDNLLLRLQFNELHDILSTNLIGPILMTKAVMKDMFSLRQGSVINIGSIVGSRGNIGQTAYSASKAGLLGVTRSHAKEFGSRNIRVNCIEPGFIQTDMTKDFNLDQKSTIINSIALEKLGMPEDVAHLAVFLASEKAKYITGQCIRVDGGLKW